MFLTQIQRILSITSFLPRTAASGTGGLYSRACAAVPRARVCAAPALHGLRAGRGEGGLLRRAAEERQQWSSAPGHHGDLPRRVALEERLRRRSAVRVRSEEREVCSSWIAVEEVREGSRGGEGCDHRRRPDSPVQRLDEEQRGDHGEEGDREVLAKDGDHEVDLDDLPPGLLIEALDLGLPQRPQEEALDELPGDAHGDEARIEEQHEAGHRGREAPRRPSSPSHARSARPRGGRRPMAEGAPPGKRGRESGRAHEIHAAVVLREPVVQHAPASSSRIGPRVNAVDERDAESAVVTAAGGFLQNIRACLP